MKRVIVQRDIKVSVTMIADDWGLYSDDDHRQPIGRETVAHSLNTCLENLVNAGGTPHSVLIALQSHAEQFSDYGATDTWVRDVMLNVIQQIFHGEYR